MCGVLIVVNWRFKMTYEQSIRSIKLYEESFYIACELAETDDNIGAALEAFSKAKAAHQAQFGKLEKREGHWS